VKCVETQNQLVGCSGAEMWGDTFPHFFPERGHFPHYITEIHVKRRPTVSYDGIIVCKTLLV